MWGVESDLGARVRLGGVEANVDGVREDLDRVGRRVRIQRLLVREAN